MRSVLAVLAAVVLVGGAVFVIRESRDEPKSTQQTLDDAQRQTTGAYGCMSREVRRRFDRAVKRYDTRFGEVLETVPDDAEPEVADRALRSDREFNELRTRARAILIPYLPGGSEFDKACYDRAVKRYDRRADQRE